MNDHQDDFALRDMWTFWSYAQDNQRASPLNSQIFTQMP